MKRKMESCHLGKNYRDKQKKKLENRRDLRAATENSQKNKKERLQE